MTRPDAIVALTDKVIVAFTLFGEARGEGPEGQIAVANVIRNRVDCQRPGFGLTVRDVCLKPQQFSCWNESDPNYALLLDMATVFKAGAEPGPVLRQCFWIAAGLAAGEFVDNTHGATHYLVRTLLASAPPNWAAGQKVLAVLGAHAFLRVA